MTPMTLYTRPEVSYMADSQSLTVVDHRETEDARLAHDRRRTHDRAEKLTCRQGVGGSAGFHAPVAISLMKSSTSAASNLVSRPTL
jgi:hypothetical protein